MKNCGFCEELLSENDFQVLLVNFSCYHCGAILRQFRSLAQATRTLLELCQLTKIANFIATPMKNIWQFITCLLEIQVKFLFFS